MEDAEAIALRDDPRGVVLPIRALPRAGRVGLAGVSGGAVRVAVTAPPEGGRANRAIVEALAEAIGVSRARIRILRGERARSKSILVEGETAATLRPRLARALGGPSRP
ncbi:MAG: DUF167 domain-containing protein [Planctomycetes bacterium]|nr:DUF167 domain-containing protein [Planctomycetota bacterium]